MFYQGSFQPFAYTYPDYSWPETLSFFTALRSLYLEQLKQSNQEPGRRNDMFVPFKGSNGSKVSANGLNEWNYFERVEPSCRPEGFPPRNGVF